MQPKFSWRTAAVIPELQEEIDIYGSEKFRGKVSELAQIEARYDHLAGLNQANSQGRGSKFFDHISIS